jgi:hypothetical protein
MRYLMLSALILTSCLNENAVPGVQTNPTEVYLAGWTDVNIEGGFSQAAYWRNKERFLLSAGLIGSSANSIIVDKGDIYVSGLIYDDHFTGKPALWKNSILEVLMLPDTLEDDYSVRLISMIFENDNLYVYGEASDNINSSNYGASPLLWKNGELVSLNGMAGKSTTGFSVSGSDIYFAGYDGCVSDNNGYWTCSIGYWKNNGFNEIADASWIDLIKISNDKVYLAGRRFGDLMGYWTEGVDFRPLELPGDRIHIQYSELVDIEVRNGDVFVLGQLNYEGYMDGETYKDYANSIVLWKNGSIEQVMGGVELCSARALSVFNNQVYVLGGTNLGNVLWKIDNSFKSKVEVLPSDHHVGSFFLR